MKAIEFTTKERFYCQWEHGAKEYYGTLQEAIDKAKSHFVKRDGMSEESHQNWLKSKHFVGKEVVITQQLVVIEVS